MESLDHIQNKVLISNIKTENKEEPEGNEKAAKRIKVEPEIDSTIAIKKEFPIKQELTYDFGLQVKEEIDARSCIVEIRQTTVVEPEISDVPIKNEITNDCKSQMVDQIKEEDTIEVETTLITKSRKVRPLKTKQYIFPSSCEMCDEILLNPNHFIQHTMVHARNSSNSNRSKEVDEKAEYSQESNQYNGKQKFRCSICGKTYHHKSQKAFKKHMKTHSTKRSFNRDPIKTRQAKVVEPEIPAEIPFTFDEKANTKEEAPITSNPQPKKPQKFRPRKTKQYIFPSSCEMCEEIILDIEHFIEHTMNHARNSTNTNNSEEDEGTEYSQEFCHYNYPVLDPFEVGQAILVEPEISVVPVKYEDFSEITNKQIKKEKIKVEEPINSDTLSFVNETPITKKPKVRQPKTKQYIFPSSCEMCDEIILDVEHFIEHTMNHSKNWTDPNSSEAIERAEYSQDFLRCSICGRTYRRKRLSHFKEHMYTHSDERNFECDICGKTFKVPRYLREHKLNVHKTVSKVSNKRKTE